MAVLPELWDLSFYPPDVYDLADEEGRQAQAFLQDLASSCHIQLIGGSIVRRHDGCLYNTTYIVDEEVNRVSSYDKCHLFTPGGEEKVFASGDHLNTFFLGDILMASITCYDLRFGEWVRMAALAGARILFVPAAWPHPDWLIGRYSIGPGLLRTSSSSSPSTVAVPAVTTASAAIL